MNKGQSCQSCSLILIAQYTYTSLLYIPFWLLHVWHAEKTNVQKMDKSRTTRKYVYIPKTTPQGFVSPNINSSEHAGEATPTCFVSPKIDALNYYNSRKDVPFPTNTSTARCLVSSKISSSKLAGEAKLTCSGCQRKFLLPKITNAYRCYKCNSVTNSTIGSEQSRKDSGVFKHDQLNNAYPNGALLPPSASCSLSLSMTMGNKRAVICGVTYGKRKFKLEGTINDVNNMKNLLLDKFKFPIGCIRVLTGISLSPFLIGMWIFWFISILFIFYVSFFFECVAK